MKLHDTIIGAFLILLGGFVLWQAAGFPEMPGQIIGPGTLPNLLGMALVAGGLAVGLPALRRRAPEPWVVLHEGWRVKGGVLSAVVVVAGTTLAAMTFDTLGFPLVGFALLTALYLSAGMRHIGLVALSAIFVLLVHIGMTRFLYVPLPAGLLEGWL